MGGGSRPDSNNITHCVIHRGGSSKFITNYLASRTPTLCYVIYVHAPFEKVIMIQTSWQASLAIM